MSFTKLGIGSSDFDLHSVENHELTLPAHQFSAPSAGHFGETVGMN